MKIAIEIDNIVRDNNAQALKYYLKAFSGNTDFDSSTADLECSDLLSSLPFSSKEARKVFKETDYPYELFGCARTMHKHLHVEIEDWLAEHEGDEIIYFTLNETNLMIQSTYFFLSKGSKVRTVIFPKNAADIWNYCDMAVTINKDVVSSKPEGKKVVVIKKSDNSQLQKKADMVYDNLIALLKDEDFEKKEIENKKHILTPLRKLWIMLTKKRWWI